MPTRSLEFEGGKLEVLLEQVKQEIGPKARIVKATRTRRGGFAGFFARERFIVSVEIEDEPEEPVGSGSAESAGAGLEEPVGPAVSPGSPVHAIREALSRPEPKPKPESMERSSGAVEAAIAMVEQALASSAAAAAAPGPAPADRALLADRTEDLLELSSAGSSTAGAPPTPDSPAATFAEVLALVGQATRGEAGRSNGHRPVTAAASEAPPPASAPAPETPPPGPDAPRPGEPPVDDPPPTDTSSIQRPPVQVVAGPGVAVSPVTNALCAAGVPLAMLPDPTILDFLGRLTERKGGRSYLLLALTQMFEQLPAIPLMPVRNGSVFAVVGELQRVQALAAQLAGETGLDADEVVVAAKSKPRGLPANLFVRTIEDAAELAPGWRRGSTVTVVAVATALGAPSRTWTRHLLEAVRPAAVWGVVPATQKHEDISAWAHDLGGLDALALDGVAETVSPASTLSSGIPVVRLDGHPATASLWASVVAERILAPPPTPERIAPGRQDGQLSWC